MDEGRLQRLIGARPLGDFFELAEGPEFQPTEVLAAARMLQRVASPREMETLLDQIRAIPGRPTPKLDRLSQGWLRYKAQLEAGLQPFEEAYRMASWVRKASSLPDDAKVDPRAWLDCFGVQVVEFQGPSWLDALACWGPLHGPAVLLNTASERHRGSPAARSASLAHEIGHLVADRDGYLPLADVLAGRPKPVVEQRARAFAAEFLFPRDVAAARFRECQSATEVDRELFASTEDFGVSAEIVAWQVRNAPTPPRRFVLDELIGHVRERERYYLP